MTELETNRVLVMPRPATFTLTNGLEDNNPINEIDTQGFSTLVENNFSGRKPKMTLTFSGRNLDNTAMQIGQKIKTVNIDLRFPYRQQVRRQTYVAAPTGKLGSNLVEDADTRGSMHVPNTRETIQLLQQNFATFNPTITRSFAIGAGFQRKFSDDLVTEENFVTLVPLGNYDARGLSEETLGNLEVNGLCFNSAGHLSIFHVPVCFVNPEGAGITEDNQVQINLDISGLTSCQPWNEYEIPFESFCEN